ncbi:uncharacterized protein LOC108112465 [Drosophila eugracilis]|uniref:uncharacterized protein LOC108112465 n=1 Tax=Drosophila eugracilis TaxID=29029 RepID=UPI0007E7EF44|nr:uncharacterized protein LOC108112465 [Drosophila eugracilis]
MSSTRDKLYMCTECFQRYPWKDLSEKEHRCFRCRLETKMCAICDRKFEPRQKSHVYCKRCDFYMLTHAAVQPIPVQDPNVEPEREEPSFIERWNEIKAAGIVDEFFGD